MQFFSVAERAELVKLAREGKDNGQYTKVMAQIWGGTGGRWGMRSSSKPFEQMGQMALLKQVPKWDDPLKTTPELEGSQPVFVTFRHESYRAAYKYLWEKVQNDPSGLYKEQASSLGEAMAYTKELIGHEIFNRATDSTLTSGIDGLPLADNAHKTALNFSYDNNLAAAAIGEAYYESVEGYFKAVPDEHGRPTPVGSYTMLVDTSKETQHAQILGAGSAIQLVTGAIQTGTNINPNEQIPNRLKVQGSLQRGLLATNYFTSVNTAFALGAGHELIWYDRWSMQDMYDLNDPKAEVQRIWYNGSRGWKDARRILYCPTS